jgi:hypothetical protein
MIEILSMLKHLQAENKTLKAALESKSPGITEPKSIFGEQGGISSVTANMTTSPTSFSPVTADSDRMDRIETSLQDVMKMMNLIMRKSDKDPNQPPSTPDVPSHDPKRQRNDNSTDPNTAPPAIFLNGSTAEAPPPEPSLGKRVCNSSTPVSRRLQYTETDMLEDDYNPQPPEHILYRNEGGQSSPQTKK